MHEISSYHAWDNNKCLVLRKLCWDCGQNMKMFHNLGLWGY